MLHLKKPIWKRKIKHLIVAPFILSVIIPLIILDVWMEIYHRICFFLCGIPYIHRSKYIKIDRHKLQYLNPIQKIFCTYCGYGNGLLNYCAQIAAASEHYWCGIQHKKDPNFTPPPHHEKFTEYGNEDEFNKKYRQ